MTEPAVRPKTGRPPVRPTGEGPTTLTLKIPARVKRLLVDQADAYDLTLTEYLVSLVERDAQDA